MLGYNKTLFASTANSILVLPEEAVKSFSATISSLLERAAIFSGNKLANSFPEKINSITLGTIQSNLGRWATQETSSSITTQDNFPNASKIIAMGMSSFDGTTNRLSICAILSQNEEIYSNVYEFNSDKYRVQLKYYFSASNNFSTVYFDSQRQIDNNWYSAYLTKMVMAIPIS